VVTQERQHDEKEGEVDTSHERKAQEPGRKNAEARSRYLKRKRIWTPDQINQGVRVFLLNKSYQQQRHSGKQIEPSACKAKS